VLFEAFRSSDIPQLLRVRYDVANAMLLLRENYVRGGLASVASISNRMRKQAPTKIQIHG